MLQKILILTICLLAIATMVVANEANEEELKKSMRLIETKKFSHLKK